MNLGGTSVPDATADNAPIPIFVNRCLSKTFVLTFEFFAIFLAFNALGDWVSQYCQAYFQYREQNTH